MTDRTEQVITALQLIDPAARVENVGGNCRAIVAELPNGQQVMVSNRDGGDLPDDDGALVGIYRKDGDTDDDPTITAHGPEIWDALTDTVEHALTLDHARRGKA